MSPVDQALDALISGFYVLYALFVRVFDVIEAFLRNALLHIGIGGQLQAVVILVAAILFIVAVFKVFGGVIRILLLLFLVLLILHTLAPLFRA